MKLFYDHLIIDLHSVYAEIERLEIDAKDKQELVKLVDATTHHTVLDTILHYLDKSHHHTFLDHFHRVPHDPKILEFLRDKIADIEDNITQSAKKLTTKLLADLRRSK